METAEKLRKLTQDLRGTVDSLNTLLRSVSHPRAERSILDARMNVQTAASQLERAANFVTPKDSS